MNPWMGHTRNLRAEIACPPCPQIDGGINAVGIAPGAMHGEIPLHRIWAAQRGPA
jgi:hypothetical protein